VVARICSGRQLVKCWFVSERRSCCRSGASKLSGACQTAQGVVIKFRSSSQRIDDSSNEIGSRFTLEGCASLLRRAEGGSVCQRVTIRSEGYASNVAARIGNVGLHNPATAIRRVVKKEGGIVRAVRRRIVSHRLFDYPAPRIVL